jgi:hypothetical protein
MIGELLDFIRRSDDPWKIVDMIEDDWCRYGSMKQDRERGILELVTGGWSGNECIIRALQLNPLFWGKYWMMSKRGGYYRFEGLR